MRPMIDLRPAKGSHLLSIFGNRSPASLGRFWQSMWALARKDLKSALTERSTLLQTITLPINYLILLSLFALSGNNAPTAVVLLDHGYYAQRFVAAMNQAHSFHIVVESADAARQQYEEGTLVTLVTIPADFDNRVRADQPVQIHAAINDLDEDLTDDAQRALALSVTIFYSQNFPQMVPIMTVERDAYPSDTDYIPYLALSIMVISLLITGLLQAGMAAAREWEKGTMKELLLAPVSAWTLVAGKILATFIVGLPSIVVVLFVVVVFIGDLPVNFPFVIGVSLLSLLVFAAAGVALGMALKDRGTLTTISRALAVPLLFLSGLFAPVSFNTGAIQFLARLFPVHYSIVLIQAAFKGFVSNTLPLPINALMLCAYGLVFVLFANLSVRLSKLAH
jgi:ABC-2 type transport system permease protein